MAVGDVYYTSWGYDQTNVEFFEVVRETEASVVLRALASEVRDGRLFARPGEYVVDFLMSSRQRSVDRDRERGYSEKLCRKNRYGTLKLDSSRRAYLWDGSGKYDTYAAGGVGH